MRLTLNTIKNNFSGQKPCEGGWKVLLKSLNKVEADDTKVTINHLLKSNGVDDALWVIYNCIEGKVEEKNKMIHEIAQLAIEPAESVLHIFEEKYPDDKRPREAIEKAKKYFENPNKGNAEAAEAAAEAAARAAAEAAEAAEAAAEAAARAAAWAAWAAAWAARAAAEAAAEAAGQEITEKQKKIILKYFGE